MVAVKKITSWSFSRYSTYKGCPFKAKLKFIDKLKEPGSKALEHGAKVHDEIEAYIKGGKLTPTVKGLHQNVVHFIKGLRPLYKHTKLTVEATWAFTKDWMITTYDDWDNCMLRVKVDVAEHGGTVLKVYDWKTGKFREEKNDEYVEQLELYALSALVMFPILEEVRTQLVYVEHDLTYPKGDEFLVFTRGDVPRLKKLWEKRTRAMLNDTKFAPRPSRDCSYCHFRKANGGPCKF